MKRTESRKETNGLVGVVPRVPDAHSVAGFLASPCIGGEFAWPELADRET